MNGGVPDKTMKELEARSPDRAMRPILVVEDNPMDLDFVIQAFEENNVVNPVHVCRDGEEALRFIAAHGTPNDPDLPMLVLLDLRLPKVDGIEVLRQARQHPVWKLVPCIAMTTSRQHTDIARAYDLGVNSYIVKPVDFAALVEVVKNIKTYWLLTNQPAVWLRRCLGFCSTKTRANRPKMGYGTLRKGVTADA